ncbi:MAG: hypothetical protein EA422_16320 [Gemmatimonadales bacterium]|nr:MAG: hypothetical protein EA422_16320 [Gemmatimonadales bacterium]
MDWTAPALPAAAGLLLERAKREKWDDGSPGSLDLSELLVVLPGGRAGRRLLELLLDGAEAQDRVLRPPRMATLGALPEILFPPQLPEPGPLVERRVWAEALRTLPDQAMERLLASPPESEDLAQWMGLGKMIRELQRTVGAGGHTFADVAHACREGFLFNDEERWRILARVQAEVRGRWRRLGLEDAETRRERVLSGAEAAGEEEGFTGELWLVGVAEMSGLVRGVLGRALAGGRVQVHTVVHAPSTWDDRFDAMGCVEPARWSEAGELIPEDAIRVVEGPREQAREVIHLLREAAPEAGAGLATEAGAGLAPEDVTVGVPDPEVIPFLTDRLAREGVTSRLAEGIPLERTLPARLLAAVADFLEEGEWEGLAALLRHPDLRLESDGGVDLADRYHALHLPARIRRPERASPGEGWLPSRGENGGRVGREFSGTLDRLLDEVLGDLLGPPRPLARWGEPLAAVLLAVYGADAALDPHRPGDREVVAVSRALAEAIQDMERIPPELDTPVPGAVALRVVLDELRGRALPPGADAEAVELLGWLELHLDDVPHMVITGVNEPHLPEAVTGDPFLPHELRRGLGLLDNERRWARDLYQLAAIVHARPGTRIVTGRRTLAGDPLRPSRLLLAVEGKPLARRLLRFLGEGGEDGAGGAVGAGGPPNAARDPFARDPFALPPEPVIQVARPPRRLAVTAFRSLLADPYRFALERILRLDTVDDRAREMDPMIFGVVTHAVLEGLGRASLREEGGRLPADEVELRRRLDELLDREMAGRFGRHAHPAVRLQGEQIRGRLHAFASWQAERSREGWILAQVEAGPPLLPESERRGPTERGRLFPVDGEPFYLSGRIDRVDHHPETGAWCLLDYKTSKKARTPDQVHRKRQGRGRDAPHRWVDLQLPLYRHLVEGIPEEARDQVQLGYLNLPADRDRTGVELARWDEVELEEADQEAREAIRRLRLGVFEWDPAAARVRRDDALAPLLGVGVMEELDDDEEAENDQD